MIFIKLFIVALKLSNNINLLFIFFFYLFTLFIEDIIKYFETEHKRKILGNVKKI